jgi:hypothetical protein
LNDKLRHLRDNSIAEKELTQLKYAEGKAKIQKKKKKKKIERNIYQYVSAHSVGQDECYA